MKVIPEPSRAHYIWYLRFYYYHWVDTSDGGLLVPKGIMTGQITYRMAVTERIDIKYYVLTIM